MKGDFSRSTFDPKKHYSSVRMQQGRVQLDADWNEQSGIISYRTETEAEDIIGHCGGPMGNAAFKIYTEIKDVPNEEKDPLHAGYYGTLKQCDFFLSAGRYYVDGILCENEYAIPFTMQPDLQDIKPIERPGIYLLYLDVWQRHITPLDDPNIREVALGGPDTATRTKTVWQVKLFCVPDTMKPPVNCLTKVQEFDDLIASATGKLSAWTKPGQSIADPCIVPPVAGYRGLENQLYRVEIHDSSNYKWSRDNGAIVTSIVKINGNEITVSGLGSDDTIGFKSAPWIEILDDCLELNGSPGQILEVDYVDPARRMISVKNPKGINLLQCINLQRNPKLRRWDGYTKKKNNAWLDIESGIQVHFEGGIYRTGDFWQIPARAATADSQSGNIEWPEDSKGNPVGLLPFGIQHYYARLALITAEKGNGNEITIVKVQDCRSLFPPVTELTSFFYISGDGQEAMPDLTNAPGFVQLPNPLEVGVANGSHPVIGAKVRFKIIQGQGKVIANLLNSAISSNITTVDILTDTQGLARCDWQLDSNNWSQQVEARLLDANDNPIHLPIIFNANLSVASKVAYNPGCDGKEEPTVWSELKKVPDKKDLTVAAILDKLLCTFNSTHLPIEKNNELCDTLRGNKEVTTVQDALNALCQTRGSGCCMVTVGEGGQYETIENAVDYLRKQEKKDICICMLPGDHKLDRYTLEGKLNLKIVGCGPGTRINLSDLLSFAGLASFTLRDVEVIADLPAAMTIENCNEVTISSCHFTSATEESNPFLRISNASRIHIKDNVIRAYLQKVEDTKQSLVTAIVIRDGFAETILENNDIIGIVSLYGVPGNFELEEKIHDNIKMLFNNNTVKHSSGTLQIRNNRLTRLCVASDIARALKDPEKEISVPLFHVGFITDNLILEGNNQMLAKHLTLTSNSFDVQSGRAGTVIAESAIFMGNHAQVISMNKSFTVLIYYALFSTEAANLIKIIPGN